VFAAQRYFVDCFVRDPALEKVDGENRWEKIVDSRKVNFKRNGKKLHSQSNKILSIGKNYAIQAKLRQTRQI
jgi:hypothetical protein